MAPSAEASAVQQVQSYPRFPHTGWGVIPGPKEQPETPPGGRTPNLPGDFVSEELRADCTRFLEAIHALVERRAEMMLGAKTRWVPDPPRVNAGEDAGTPPSLT